MKTLWSFALGHPIAGEAGLEFVQHAGPMPAERIRQLVGGDYELLPLRDSTCLALRTEREGLEPNPHYPGLTGPILVGKLVGEDFVGVLGIETE
jgi:hypothetical protein